IIAGGPASTSHESKYPGRGDKTFNTFPSLSPSGVQSIRLSDVAMRMSGTLKYIQYLPLTFVAMRRLPSTLVRIAPDFVSSFRYFPLAVFSIAGPCLCHCRRYFYVVIASLVTSIFHILIVKILVTIYV